MVTSPMAKYTGMHTHKVYTTTVNIMPYTKYNKHVPGAFSASK